MKNTIKNLLVTLIIIFSILGIITSSVVAQDFPNKPIIAMVAFGPGGSTDTTMRLIQPYLEKELGVPVIVENHPGAGTEIANTLLLSKPADGYTFEAANWEHLVLTTIKQEPKYSYDDFTPLVIQAVNKLILLVKKDSPINNLKDFIEEAKKNPGKLSISCSAGGCQELQMLILRDKFGIDFKVIEYSGGAAARTAMLGGHTDAATGEVTGAYYLREETKAIVIFSDEPDSMWPEAEPITEQVKSYDVDIPILVAYEIYLVQKELKEQYPDRYDILVNAFLKASQDPEYLKTAEDLGVTSALVWKRAEEYKDEFEKAYKLFQDTKDLWQ